MRAHVRGLVVINCIRDNQRKRGQKEKLKQKTSCFVKDDVPSSVLSLKYVVLREDGSLTLRLKTASMNHGRLFGFGAQTGKSGQK